MFLHDTDCACTNHYCLVFLMADRLHRDEGRQQPQAKRALQEIWMAETKQDALAAFPLQRAR
jgi:hypothetical protein